jgi:choline dehydrogenase-like flavoprotein
MQNLLITVALFLGLLSTPLVGANKADGGTFDFIILAAGTSGSVLARRLSENPSWRVLVLEAGSKGAEKNLLPLNVNRLPSDCSNSFGFEYEPSDDSCLAMKNQQCYLQVSKGLGGQSLLDNMLYSRGNQWDYDNWCLSGNRGWCFEDVLPFYKKLENITIPGGKVKHCCKDGLLTVSYPSYRTKLASTFLKAGEELGYPSGVNYNGKHQTGFAYVQTLLKNGLRQNIYDTYLAPVEDKRPNLDVRTEIKVQKLVFKKNGPKHTGSKVVAVEYDHLGFQYTAKAIREVIITTSPVEAAQLLMLSGVGPADHLKTHGIEVVKNLPVGQNYHDVVAVGGLVFFSNVKVPDLEKTFTKKGIADYLENKSGAAGSPFAEALAFLESSKQFCNYPDYQLTIRAGSFLSQPQRRVNYNLNVSMFDAHFGDVAYKASNSFEILPIVSRPKSRGVVLLRSNNPEDAPIVHGNFYSHPQDVKTALYGIKTALKLVKTEAFQAINAKFFDKPFEPCSHFEYGCDKYWECFARSFTFPMARWAGATKMGNGADSVVDDKLRVHGIKNLRVVGSSVLPQQITGQVGGIRVMLGEKMADMICKYHNFLDETDPRLRLESKIKKI